MSPTQWIKRTNAVGIISKAGRYSIGTYAHPDIAFEFASFLFISLINNSYLEKMGNVINKPLINSKQKDFLSKIEEIKNEALKIKFIYNGKEAIAFRKFVDSYANLLMELYQYMSLLDLIKEMQEKDKNNMDVHEIADKVDEKNRRKVLFEKIDALKESYNKIEVGNVVEKIEKQIKM